MPKILQHFEQGNKSSNNLVVFLQGWPDNSRMWQLINWKQDISDRHLLFINFPNTNGKVTQKWGRDFPALVQDLKYTLDSLPIAPKNKTLVAHDWGCFYGYMFDSKYPEYFNHIITMDVSPRPKITQIKSIIYVLMYQFILITAFLIGGKIGQIITQKMAGFMKYNPPYLNKITSFQNYPYYYLYRNKILSLFGLAQPFLRGYKPSAPVSYLYGSKKPFQFHDEKWLTMVKEGGGDVHPMEEGHWFMKKYGKFISELINQKSAKKRE